ncbi:MAG: hypothetical protein AAFV49_13150 [Pseudomonadota bacterium]
MKLAKYPISAQRDITRATAFTGIYILSLYIQHTFDPIVVTITLTLSIAMFKIALTDNTIKIYNRMTIAALVSVYALILGVAFLNEPTIMQRLITAGALLLLIHDTGKWIVAARLVEEPDWIQENPGTHNVDDIRRECKRSVLQMSCLVVCNELGIALGNEITWVVLMSAYIMLSRRVVSLAVTQ